jgi:hypothetical protein
MRTVLDDMQRDPSSAHKHMQVTLSVYVCVCVCLSVCVYLSGCFFSLQMAGRACESKYRGSKEIKNKTRSNTRQIARVKTSIETLQYKNKDKKIKIKHMAGRACESKHRDSNGRRNHPGRIVA